MSNQIVYILIQCSIFLYASYFFRTPFEFYTAYLVFALFFPFFIAKYGIPRLPVLIFLPLLASGTVYIQMGLNTWPLFVKVFAGYFLSVLFFFYVMRLYDYDVKRMFRHYMKAALIVCFIGLFQVFSYFIGFKPGYNYYFLLNKWAVVYGSIGIRMNSIFSEPSYFAAVIAPAFFVGLYNLIKKTDLFISRRQSLVVVIAYFLTFSSVGIFGVFIAIFLFFVNFGLIRYAVIFVPVSYIFFTFAYTNIEEFQVRYDSTLEIFNAQGDVNTQEIHGSSFVLYNNFHIAWENFKENPLFGTGLGSHPIAFDKYTLTRSDEVIQINFNKADANSMFLRLMSETGLYGLIFVLWFLFRNLVFRQKAGDDEHWIISNSLLLIVALYLLRQGHYFLNGLPFFMWLYYYTRKSNDLILAARTKEEALPENTELSPASA